MPEEKSVIAKIKKGGKEFEILIHPEQASLYRQGKSVSLDDVLVIEGIYEDAKKGKRASEHEMKKLFGTDDPLEVAKIILKEGHVPLTEEMLKKEVEQRRKQIVDLLHRNVVDPNNGKPHPPNRIETAMHDAKVKIDAHKSAEAQLHEIVKALREHLPIKFEIRELYLRIPVKYAGRALITLKQMTKILKENWESDGSLSATVEIPAGLQEELETSLNNLTKGDIELKILGAK